MILTSSVGYVRPIIFDSHMSRAVGHGRYRIDRMHVGSLAREEELAERTVLDSLTASRMNATRLRWAHVGGRHSELVDNSARRILRNA